MQYGWRPLSKRLFLEITIPGGANLTYRTRLLLEDLESRRVLAYTFSSELVPLPINGRSGVEMEVVDLNLDNKLDLIVGTSSATVDILFGQGDRAFALDRSIAVDGSVKQLVPTDFNNDKLIDLLVITDRQFVPLMNQGKLDGVWQGFRQATPTAQDRIYRAEVGFVNDDDHIDIVYGVDNEIRVELGSGDGEFSPNVTWLLPVDQLNLHEFDVGDINADGFADIVVTAYGIGAIEGVVGGRLTILTNDQSGGFTSEHSGRGGFSVDIFDYDRDGHLDLSIPDASLLGEGFYMSMIHKGDGKGGWDFASAVVPGRARVESASGARAYTIPEINTHSGLVPGGLVFEPNDFAGTPTDQLEPDGLISLAPWRNGIQPHFADIDQDGVDEVIGISDDTLAVFYPGANSTLFADKHQDIAFRVLNPVPTVFIGDFDGNGFTDLAQSVQPRGNFVTWVTWGGPDGLSERQRFLISATDIEATLPSFGTADVNGDGISDILLGSARSKADGTTGELALLGNHDRSFTTAILDDLELPSAAKQHLGDIDGDGYLDLATTEQTTKNTIISVKRGLPPNEPGGALAFEAVGTHYLIESRLGYDPFVSFRTSGLRDVTGDGVLDFILYQDTLHNIVVLPGSSSFQQGDVNRDGDVDVLDLSALTSIAQEPSHANDTSLRADVTGDGTVNQRDVDYWLDGLAKSRRGDANLDDKVDFADFLALSANFGKDDASWSDGDFTGDGKVSFDDFLLLSKHFGFGG